MENTLTNTRLEECEKIIEKGLNTFVEVGAALLEIRDSRLYKGSHDTFEDYCRDRWGMERRYAYRLMDAAGVVGNVSNWTQTLPATESQARPLVGLHPEQQFQVWQEVIQNAEGLGITAKDVQKVVDRVIRKKEQEEYRQAERQKIADAGKDISIKNKWNVYQADMQTWQPNKQYDFIITDPPYPKEYLHLYEVLAYRASEWLKDGGLLIAMCGQSYLDEIYALMSKHIKYYWTGAYLTPGQPTPLRQVNVNTTWKPLLMFSKGKYKGKIFGDVFTSEGNDKSLHKWGQSESGMYSIVSKICLEGQSIFDPFCGAGTTGVSALKFGCLFDGIDIDETNVNISKARLNDAEKS